MISGVGHVLVQAAKVRREADVHARHEHTVVVCALDRMRFLGQILRSDSALSPPPRVRVDSCWLLVARNTMLFNRLNGKRLVSVWVGFLARLHPRL